MIIAELFASLGLLPDMESWQKGDALIGKIGKVAVGVGAAIAGAFAVSKIRSWVNEVADAGSAADDLSQRLGLSAEAVQEFDYALKREDASIGDLKMAMKTLANSGVKDVEEGILKLADQFQQMEDGPKKTKLAIEKLGKSGIALIPFLNNGRAGIQGMREDARRLGVVIDNETVGAFANFGDTTYKLDAAWRGIKTRLVTAILPALQELVDKANAWIATHQDEIARALSVAIDLAATAMKGLGYAVEAIIEVLGFLSEHMEVVRAAGIALGIVLGVLAVEAALAAAPFLLIVAAATALVLAVEDVWKSFTTGKGVTARAIEWIERKWEGFVDKLKEFRKDARAFFRGIGDSIRQALSDAFDAVRDKAKEVWEEIKEIPVIGHGARAIEGLTEGPGLNEINQVLNRQVSSANTYTPTLADRLSAGASDIGAQIGGNVSVNAPITINPAPGMSEERIGQAAQEALQSKLTQAYDAARGGRR